jgi:hypothetical protein
VRIYDVVPVPRRTPPTPTGRSSPTSGGSTTWDLRGLDATVSTSEHVVAVPLGENAWQTTVERFLLTRSGEELGRLLDEEQP